MTTINLVTRLYIVKLIILAILSVSKSDIHKFDYSSGSASSESVSSESTKVHNTTLEMGNSVTPVTSTQNAMDLEQLCPHNGSVSLLKSRSSPAVMCNTSDHEFWRMACRCSQHRTRESQDQEQCPKCSTRTNHQFNDTTITTNYTANAATPTNNSTSTHHYTTPVITSSSKAESSSVTVTTSTTTTTTAPSSKPHQNMNYITNIAGNKIKVNTTGYLEEDEVIFIRLG